MRHLYSVLCRRAVIEQDTGSLMLIDIPEIMTLPSSPTNDTSIRVDLILFVAFYCEAGSLKTEIRAQIRAPGGEVDELVAASTVSGDENAMLRMMIKIRSMTYRGPGKYEVDLLTRETPKQKWKTASSYPLLVRLNLPVDSATEL
jgi:hypothetical protein